MRWDCDKQHNNARTKNVITSRKLSTLLLVSLAMPATRRQGLAYYPGVHFWGGSDSCATGRREEVTNMKVMN